MEINKPNFNLFVICLEVQSKVIGLELLTSLEHIILNLL